MSGEVARRPRPALAMAITLPALAGLAGIAIATADNRLTSTLFLALAVCALGATFFTVELSRTSFFDASLVPAMLASAFAGPAAAGVIAVVAETGTWLNQRHRLRAAAINLASIAAPFIAWSLMADGIAGHAGTLAWYLILLTFPAFTTLLNVASVYYGIRLLDGEFEFHPSSAYRQVLPTIAINTIVGVAAAAVYADSGLAALLFVLASIGVFAHMAGLATAAKQRTCELEQLNASRARLADQVIATKEAERRRLADALHDEAVQNLLVIRQDLAGAGAANAIDDFGSTILAVDATVMQLRTAIFELRPPGLEEAGLVTAIERVASDQADRGGFCVEVDADTDESLSSGQEEIVFGVTRELLRNVTRHSGANLVSVRLRAHNGCAEVVVTDDGLGFSPDRLRTAATAGHFGLRSCSEKLKSAGGLFEVSSTPNCGTSVRLQLPG